jgi:biotin carboxyl carrier protein
MTNYEIAVNGKSYEVTVQKKRVVSAAAVSVLKTAAPAAVPVAPVISAAPVPPAPVVAAPKAASAAGSAGAIVLAPMPGKVIAVKVNIGDSVKKGQELLIMEAMKMHNPILAAREGIIHELLVKVNDSVQSGQKLLSVG